MLSQGLSYESQHFCKGLNPLTPSPLLFPLCGACILSLLNANSCEDYGVCFKTNFSKKKIEQTLLHRISWIWGGSHCDILKML